VPELSGYLCLTTLHAKNCREPVNESKQRQHETGRKTS
jgi:type II secretory ATPase GspE/PulE/Tfp pilus assembly ATPase PilB-like protein